MLGNWGWVVWLTVALAAGAMSFIYAALETAVYMMNKVRLDLRAESGSPLAIALRRMLAKPSNFLAVLLIGSNVMEYAVTFAISAMFVLGGAGDQAEWYSLAAATPVLFILCTSVPKNVAQRSADRMAYRLAPVLDISSKVFNACGLSPLVRGFSWLLMRLAGASRRGGEPLAHEGVMAVVAEAHASGLLTHTQTIMADRVMHLAEVTLHKIMIPMDKVVSAPREVTHVQLLQTMRQHNFSRLPLIDREGKIAGVLNIYDAMTSNPDAAPLTLAQPPLVLPSTSSVTDALYRMQRTHSPMAAVEESGKHIGIVTVKDLVEEIVGELQQW